jgi:indole-3-glycerol phosphate synthase
VVAAARRFSQAISEGDGISVIVAVGGPEDARRAEDDGAEAVLVSSGSEAKLAGIRDATSLPILFDWDGERPDVIEGADACVVEAGGERDREWLERVHGELGDRFEIALRIHDEDHLEAALEHFDPELFVLAAPDEEGDVALERVLELLPDVPAGKLAIAELPGSGREQVAELERAGVDAVIVGATNAAELVGGAPPTL